MFFLLIFVCLIFIFYYHLVDSGVSFRTMVNYFFVTLFFWFILEDIQNKMYNWSCIKHVFIFNYYHTIHPKKTVNAESAVIFKEILITRQRNNCKCACTLSFSTYTSVYQIKSTIWTYKPYFKEFYHNYTHLFGIGTSRTNKNDEVWCVHVISIANHRAHLGKCLDRNTKTSSTARKTKTLRFYISIWKVWVKACNDKHHNAEGVFVVHVFTVF